MNNIIINGDVIWRRNEIHDLEYATVQVASGATLTIEAGAQVMNGSIEAFGTVRVAGAADSRVLLQDVDLRYTGTSAAEPGMLDISYADIQGGTIAAATGASGYGTLALTNSIVTDLEASIYLWYPTSDALIQGNIFLRSAGLSIGHREASVYILNNVFAEQTGSSAVENWASYGGQTVVEHNSFLSTDRVALSIAPGYTSAAISASQNFFGTNDIAVINAMIRDGQDDLGTNSTISNSHIAVPDPATPAFSLDYTPVPIVESGNTILIMQDTVWRKGEVHDLGNREVQVANGVTLTIEEGAQVLNGSIEAFGTVRVAGTASSRVSFQDVDLRYSGTSDSEPGKLDISYASIQGGSIVSYSSGYGTLSLTNSVIANVGTEIYLRYPTSDVVIEGNIFYRSSGISIGHRDASVYIRNNAFVEQTGAFAVENWASYSGATVVEHNSFLSTDRVALSVTPGYSSAAITASENYFGTTDMSVINAMIRDRADDLASKGFVSTSHTEQPDPRTPKVTSHSGSSRNDAIIGSDASDIIFGGAGDDTLQGDAGTDFIDGGTGLDIAWYGGTRDEYTISAAADGMLIVRTSGIDGEDRLYDIERIAFSDVSLAFDVDGSAAQAYRLFRLAFDRTPDAAGLGYWMAVLDGGTALTDVAAAFAQSAEAKAQWGSQVSNSSFIHHLYEAAFNRAPEQSALDHWLYMLNNNKVTRSGMLVEFSESWEYKHALEAQLQSGIAYIPYDEPATATPGNDSLTGTTGDDMLDGGAGSDTLAGGQGNDVYVLDNPGDVIAERAGEGIDTARLAFRNAATYQLAANVENAEVIAAASVKVNLTGNDLDNHLTGNGASNNLQGGAGNDTLAGGAGKDTLAGGTGDDVYIVDGTAVVTESAGAGTDRVETTLGKYVLAANVEDLRYTGTGAFSGSGNALHNVIDGRAANDTLSGLAGNDTLDGAAGNDSLAGGDGADLLLAGTGNDTVDGGAGNDVLRLKGNFADYARQRVGANDTTLVNLLTGENVTLRNVEQVLFADGGKTLAEVHFNLASIGNDVLAGTAGRDTLDGGLGNDTLAGGQGDDTYVVSAAGDVILEQAGQGVDEAVLAFAAAGKYTLAANVENATIAAGTKAAVAVTGNGLANVLTGNAGANTLNGADGNDTLIGGAGKDAMAGGAGDDLYIVDLASDTVTEAANGGFDRVETTAAAYTLSANVEDLFYTGNGKFAGTGNALGNVIAGAAGNDTLAGNGGDDVLLPGTGSDVLDGGAGTDVVELAGDFADYVRARPNATDTVLADTLTQQLVTLRNVELVRFADGLRTLAEVQANVASIANDSISGTAAGDVLDGLAGSDTLAGGAGDDTYFVDAAGDVVVEGVAGGTDEVRVVFAKAGSYVLAANVENATVATGANVAINLTGNALANALTGNVGANALDGGAGDDTISGGAGKDTLAGGAGSDLLTGGAGADVFAFAGGAGVDTITDFQSGIDKLRFVQAGLRIGDGDKSLEGAVVRAAAGGFKPTAELAVFTADIAGEIGADGAAAAIGEASAAYREGASALFVVDNGTDSAVFLFRSSAADAIVSASELTKIAVLVGTPALAPADFAFA